MGPAPEKGELVRTGDPEIVRQFQLICSFGLNSYFAVDRQDIEYNCRTSPRSTSDMYVPSLFINRIS